MIIPEPCPGEFTPCGEGSDISVINAMRVVNQRAGRREETLKLEVKLEVRTTLNLNSNGARPME